MSLTVLCILMICSRGSLAHAQKIALKTNLLYDATATVNLGAEVTLAPNWTLDISGNYNGWEFKDNRKWKHYLVQPEARYWLCEAFNGHFFGLHLHGGEFNIGRAAPPLGVLPGSKDTRAQGWFYGAGISYGYQWILGKRWNFELSAGVGYVGSEYEEYECPRCGALLGTGHKDWFGPTKLSVSIIYIIR